MITTLLNSNSRTKLILCTAKEFESAVARLFVYLKVVPFPVLERQIFAEEPTFIACNLLLDHYATATLF